jgi:hypothetical protein
MKKSLPVLLCWFCCFLAIRTNAQKWMSGRFTDVNGNSQAGLIRIPGGKGPVKDEAFIEFKEEAKANAFQLSASDLQSFVIGKDSFVVAHAPRNETWAKKEFDFVRVVLNEDIKLYLAGASGKGSRGFEFSPGIGVGTGIGTGGYGGVGAGAGVSVPIFSGDGGGDYERTTWYFGANTAVMKPLSNENFEDIMCDIMGDEPDVVDKIHRKVYVLGNIDRLIAYFKQLRSLNR